jgi:alpha-L-fucosidase 2
MGDLFLDFGRDSSEVISGYRRQLDLDSALVNVQYSTLAGEFRERVFTSHPANAMFVELSTTAE